MARSHSEVAELSITMGCVCHAKIGDLYAAMHFIESLSGIICPSKSICFPADALTVRFDVHV